MQIPRKKPYIDIAAEGRTILFPGYRSPGNFEETGSFRREPSVVPFGPYTGGTHIARPRVELAGEGMHLVDPYKLIGSCRVVSYEDNDNHITRDEIMGLNLGREERILLKTRGRNTLRNGELYVDPEAVQYLRDLGLYVFGVDVQVPSLHEVYANQAHRSLTQNAVSVFEGLDLRFVEPGKYFFYSMPKNATYDTGMPAQAALYLM